MSDDISWCPKDTCNEMECKRNPKKIRHPEFMHSFFMGIPEDCPLKKEKEKERNGNRTEHNL